jgi:uncharacterized protein
MLERVAAGRTDLVFEAVAAGTPATARDAQDIALIQWCAYHGDVSAVRFLLAHGEVLDTLGPNFDLNGAVFHGHEGLVAFLIERGADVNRPLADTGETPLHAALCKTGRPVFDRILALLLAAGADPNRATIAGVATGSFMRDCRTKGETPLHRAAAFGSLEAIQMLIDAGAKIEVRDANGDTPLSWASWYLRPNAVLRKLCYGPHRIHQDAAT